MHAEDQFRERNTPSTSSNASARCFSQTLSTLSLDQNPIGDAGVQQLADALLINKTLTALSLNRTDIGAASARSLADVLKVNRMPDTRFPFLRRATMGITTLNLRGNEIGDAGEQSKTSSLPDASLLYPTKPLTTLDLGRTGLFDEGARYLAQALTINTVRVLSYCLTNMRQRD